MTGYRATGHAPFPVVGTNGCSSDAPVAAVVPSSPAAACVVVHQDTAKSCFSSPCCATSIQHVRGARRRRCSDSLAQTPVTLPRRYTLGGSRACTRTAPGLTWHWHWHWQQSNAWPPITVTSCSTEITLLPLPYLRPEASSQGHGSTTVSPWPDTSYMETGNRGMALEAGISPVEGDENGCSRGWLRY